MDRNDRISRTMRADLQAELTGLRELVVTLRAALEQSQKENTLLRQKVDALVRRVFGASSEQVDAAQLELRLRRRHPPPSSLPPRAPAAATRPACPRICRSSRKSSSQSQ